jgi:hypothetical protein
MQAVRRDPEFQRFYRRKLVQKGMAKRAWPQFASWASGFGLCYSTKLTPR